MARELKCHTCGKLMATLRDANVRVGMVVFCQPCHEKLFVKKDIDMPDFIADLFRRK